jgi:hypothetical protein
MIIYDDVQNKNDFFFASILIFFILFYLNKDLFDRQII